MIVSVNGIIVCVGITIVIHVLVVKKNVNLITRYKDRSRVRNRGEEYDETPEAFKEKEETK